MNVLSLFDGMSCGQIALERAGIKVNKYFASEIKKHAIQVTKNNYPKTVHVGDVEKWREWKLPKIDLLIGGSPCQDFSFLKNGGEQGINGGKSSLFYEYLGCLERFKPKYFFLENVAMKDEYKNLITFALGVEPIEINSDLVSFQHRKRLYWTNIPGISIPEDRGINFQDHKETNPRICEEYRVKRTPSREIMWGNGTEGKCPNVTHRTKVNCLTVKQDRWSNAGLIEHDDFCRYLTVEECEKAQTVPLGYTNGLTRSQAYDVLGDGWTVDVVAHLFQGLRADRTT